MPEILNVVSNFWVLLAILLVLLVAKSVQIVPQSEAFIIQRLGSYQGTLNAGLHFIFPFVDSVAYKHTLKEQAIDVPSQSGITKDNITLTVDAVLYLQVMDAKLASYGVQNYKYSAIQLAQTTMRSELGKMEMEKTFEERDQLNSAIVKSINDAAQPWGVQVKRYEIKDIEPPKSIAEAMEQQMKADRTKRAAILESEGEKQSAINVAEGQKAATVLAAEADKEQRVLRAEGEALAITKVAEAQAGALKMVGAQAATDEGQKAVQFQLAQDAIEAKKAIAKESSLVVLSGDDTSIGNVVTEVMAITNKMKSNKG